MKEMWERWRERLRPEGSVRPRRLLILLGVVGIVLIGLSEWLPSEEGAEESAASAVTVTEQQVEQALEQRITALLQQVEGVGSCRVLVTLESGAQAVYAADTVTSVAADGGSSASETYLSVDTADGPVGLLLTRIQPAVKGVAVVCDGGDDPTVCARVTQVVATAFHISDRRVCVVKQE